MNATISTMPSLGSEEIEINGEKVTIYPSEYRPIKVPFTFSFASTRNSNNQLQYKSGSNTFSLPSETREITSPGDYVIIDPSNL